MQTFTVYHLQQDLLSKMLINGPRAGDPILRTYEERVIKAFKLLTSRDKLRQNEEDYFAWKEVAAGAQFLFKKGWYEKVATVVDNDAMSVVRRTTNINGYWQALSSQGIETFQVSERSTAYNDIIEVAGYFHLYLLGGFADVENGEFIAPVGALN